VGRVSRARLRLVATVAAVGTFLMLGAPVVATGTPSPNAPLAPVARTPTSSPAGAGSLRAMLALAPDVLAGPNRPTGQVAMYADQAAQLAAVGVAAPQSSSDAAGVARWTRATQWLTLPSPVGDHALIPDWRQTFGFDVFQISQSLQVGDPPNQITFLRGHFNANEVQGALTRDGYKRLDEAGVIVFSLRANATVDLTSKVGQLALASMNNAALLPDGTLVAASTLSNVRAVIAVAQGKAASLAQRVDIGALLGALATKLASAIIVPGSALRLNPAAAVVTSGPGTAAAAIATQVQALGKLPPVTLGLIGVTPGGPLPPASGGTPAPVPMGAGSARDVIALVMATQGAAEQAVPVIERRLATATSPVTQRPYNDLFSHSVVRAVPGKPVVLVELTPSSSTLPGIVVSMLFQRDLLFVAW